MARERWTRSSWTWASPPSSSTRSHEASPTPARRPSTCAWIRARALPPRICWSPPTPPSSPTSCAPTARSDSPPASPPPLCAAVRPASRSPRPRTWPSSSVRPCRRRLVAAAGTRPNGPSRHCASRSTPSSTSWSGPCPGRSTVCGSGDDWWWSPTSPWRTASSNALRAPQDLPVVPEADRPYLELLTNGAEKADTRELDHNPRSAPVRLRAAVRLRPADQAPAPEEHPSSGGPGRSGRRAGRRAHRDRAR